jgi:hypothetical protein
MATTTPVRATLAYLRTCQAARAAGSPVRYTTDPAWLVTMAINRRAGWPEPRHTRASARPTADGRYPPRAEETDSPTMIQLGHKMNGHPRVIIRPPEVPIRYRARLAHRLTTPDQEG